MSTYFLCTRKKQLKKKNERKTVNVHLMKTTNTSRHRNKLINKLTVIGFSSDIKPRYRLHNVNVI